MSLKHNAAVLPSGAHPVSTEVSDCTTECRASEHSLLVLSCAYLGNLKLLKHCATVCNNSHDIADAMGRNALHVAASKGYLNMMLWLLARKKVKVDVFDWESKWTALHRSTYYGQLGAGALLMKYGADPSAKDHDGWSPLAILHADREVFKKSLSVAAINVYTWGRNPNDTLGHDRTRNHPEKLDLTLPSADQITKIVLCKFHSVFLSGEGHVLSCGHGPGGRLGHDSEQSIVTPRLVKAMEGLVCTGIAAARDHTVILTKSGAVYTCGLNDAHQLGHGSNPTNAPSYFSSPKLVRGLKSKQVIAVGAGRYHTAVCTEKELYTVGKNLGQLGYEKNCETQVAPHAVAGVNLDNDIIIHMSASDSATALLTKKHHVFVCTNFIVRRIRFGFLDKTSCLQFEVCASLSDRDYLRKVETEPTKLLVLDSENRLWVWEPTKRGSLPTLLPGFTKKNVSHFSLGKRLTVVTKEGEVYRGNGSINQPHNLQRVPNIQNARAVFTDFKANNFAYIQDVFRSPFLPAKSQSTLTADISSLLEESSFPGSVSDINIEVGDQLFNAHKFLLNSQTCDFTSHLLPSDSYPPESTFKLRKKCDNPDVFDAFLHYVYGSSIHLVPPTKSLTETESTNDLFARVETTPDTSFASMDENDLTEEYDKFGVSNQYEEEDWLNGDVELSIQPSVQSTPQKASQSCSLSKRSNMKSTDMWSKSEYVLPVGEHKMELKALLLLATSFDLTDLKNKLEGVVSNFYKPQSLLQSQLKLRRQQTFSDLTLISKEGKELHCHRCILVARSEYFRSMLLMGWRESSGDISSLTMPVGYKVLKAVIDFIYTDEFPTTITVGADAIDWVMAVLVMADQLLLTRLKELCEYSLSKMLNLRNAVEFLEFADAYSAVQLKKSCLQFICINASCFLETRLLDNLDISLLEELSLSYQELFVSCTKRAIKFPDPSFELLPESYFCDDKLDDGVQSGASTSEDEIMHGNLHGGTADTTANTTISPRATSNSRRKRKRKTSQSERRQSSPSKSPPPTSPIEENEPLVFRANPCPPNPASPDSIVSPCSPVSALASDYSPRADSFTTCSNASGVSTTPLNSPWINIEKKRKNSNMSTPRTKYSSVEEDGAALKSYSAPVSTHQGMQQGGPTATPLSAPGKALGHTKLRGEMRTRLMNRFNSMESIEQSQTASTRPPSFQTEVNTNGPWACITTGVPGGKTLRDIIATEEENQRKNRQAKLHSPPPYSSGQDTLSSCSAHLSKSQPIPVGRTAPKEAATFSSPGNPWSTPESSPAVVSMRDLIAEAEAEDKQAKKNALKSTTKVTTVSGKAVEEKLGKRQPSVPHHQQVSFASIIKLQESERNSSRSMSNKALSLILIEERAISELEKAYSACENPDEYITVKRCSKEPYQHEHGWLAVNSPWNREP